MKQFTEDEVTSYGFFLISLIFSWFSIFYLGFGLVFHNPLLGTGIWILLMIAAWIYGIKRGF